MSTVPVQFRLTLSPAADPDAVVTFGGARFTLLTERVVRMEYHPEGGFEDRASQAFWYRKQPVPSYDVRRQDDCIDIETAALRLTYNPAAGQGFTPETLSVTVKETGAVWTPGTVDTDNLRGTTRTLDYTNGYKALLPGLMSRAGWSVVDDSNTLVLNDDSWIEPRAGGGTDLYFFGCGRDYKACLRDYCAISGVMPLIPRWILGNWWSRFWHYTQEELIALLDDFEKYGLPFSVCIVDMDWHVTKKGNTTSTGWTGYTWNRELFPDPKAFIDYAHGKRLKVSLNLHPAEGVHPHEEYYEAMARRVGIDPLSQQPVAFNITDPAFADAYFDVLHRPHEKMGIDFWWVDWQQGLTSAMPGLDPLWLINHLHFLDQGRDGERRPFIFSRWGNEGHQRYPIGFSGDSYVTWDSLAFEAYMTPVASNIAYGWWSHDIGGHTSGKEDPELYARWVQFGVLSPVNRIHVTKGVFYDRRPWLYGDAEILRVVRDALQLRHAFIPYLYTMARRAHTDSLPLSLPMYYEYPEVEAAYRAPHQYLFGSELIAAPYVAPADEHTRLSRQVVWLPEGDWTHFFTGEHFAGGWHSVYGALDDIPLFAKAGAIVPLALDAAESGVYNPDGLHVHVFAGADNRFDLYEDDGESNAYLAGQSLVTALTQVWHGSRLEFNVAAPVGETAIIPARRSYKLSIHGVSHANVSALVSGQLVSPVVSYDAQAETLHIDGITLGVNDTLAVTVSTSEATLLSRRDRTRERVMRLLKSFALHTGVRNRIADQLDEMLADPARLSPYLVAMADSQAQALFETIFDAGLHHVRDTHDPDLLVLWNNRRAERVTFRYAHLYLYFGAIWENDHARGVVPPFAYFIPPAKKWAHGAQGEHVRRTLWRAQVDYANLFTATAQHIEETP